MTDIPALGRPWPERFPGPAPQPHPPGSRLELREGLHALGFGPVQRPGGLAGRAIGPEPEALLLLGAIDPAVSGLLLLFLPQPGPEPLEVLFQDHPLPVEPAAPPPDHSGAWALRVALPPAEVLPRPAWGRLELRRALPPGPLRQPGPALHAVLFLAA